MSGTMKMLPWAGLGAILLCGCAHRPKPPATQPSVLERPVLDLRRGGGGLPLEGMQSVQSPEGLAGALLRGYQLRLMLPPGASPILAEGLAYPRLDRLCIDVSDAMVRKGYKPKQAPVPAELAPALWVKEFQYLAAPLRYGAGATYWDLVARDACFGLLAEPEGRASLVMMDAAEGCLKFRAKVQDLRPMMLAGAKNHATGGFWVLDTKLSLSCENGRSIAGELWVRAVWMLLPTTFRVSGRMTLDNAFNMHVSDLACRGEDVGGTLVAGFIEHTMRKYDGKVMPLIKFPGDKLKLRDVAIEVTDELKVTAKFGK